MIRLLLLAAVLWAQDPGESDARARLDNLRARRDALVEQRGETDPEVARLDAQIEELLKGWPKLAPPPPDAQALAGFVARFDSLLHERGLAALANGPGSAELDRIDVRIRELQEKIRAVLPHAGHPEARACARMSRERIVALSEVLERDMRPPELTAGTAGLAVGGLKLGLAASLNAAGDVVLDLSFENGAGRELARIKPGIILDLRFGGRRVQYEIQDPRPPLPPWPFPWERDLEKQAAAAKATLRITLRRDSMWMEISPKAPPVESNREPLREGKLRIAALYVSPAYRLSAKTEPLRFPEDWRSAPIYLHPQVTVRPIEGAWSGAIWSNVAEVELKGR